MQLSLFHQPCRIASRLILMGYISSMLIPVSGSASPTLELDANTVFENGPARQLVGTFHVADGEPGATYTLSLNPAIDANRAFSVEGMELWTAISFNYEARSSYNIKVDVEDSGGSLSSKLVNIQVLDREGAFDQNGYATAEVAAAYPEINEGDFIIWNPTSSRTPDIYYSAGVISLSYPNKILIRAGNYRKISLDLSGVTGNSATERVPVSNFLGQVYAYQVGLTGGQFWRFTGHYDPATGLGNEQYPGCNGPEGPEQFAFSHGRYGIWVSNEWANESDSLLYVKGAASGWEIDHLELSDGGFAGMLLKQDNTDAHDMNDVYLHHLYIHDTGSEGIYLGSTQTDPQHQFYDLLIENIVILRTGTEALQVGQLGDGCTVKNSVFWGAMDWLSPFSRWQDNCVQVAVRQGGVSFENNILLAGAGNFYNTSHTPKASIQPNDRPIAFRNNVNWGCRAGSGVYQAKDSDGQAPWVWEGNFWGGWEFSLDRVLISPNDSGGILLMATNGTTVDLAGNVFDASRQRFLTIWGGNSQVNEVGSIQKEVLPPRFLNLVGEEPLDILRWMRWTATIGEDPGFPSSGTWKGEFVTFMPGDVVQMATSGRTRFYRCLQVNTGHPPPLEGDDTWELLQWTNGNRVQFCPPDGARLIEGSLYHELGIGVGGEHSADTDLDELPDQWEQRHGLNPENGSGTQGRDGDPDQDGRSNYVEFIQGTHPTLHDQASAPEVLISGGLYHLDWNPPRGRAWKYRVSNNLTDWQDLTDFQSAGSPAATEATSLANGERFFDAVIALENHLDLLP